MGAVLGSVGNRSIVLSIVGTLSAALLAAALFTTASLFLTTAHATAAAAGQAAAGNHDNAAGPGGKLLVVKGTLVTSKCMNKGKLKACYLWWYDPKSLVLFTDKRTLYDLRFVDVPQWKLDKGYAKQVAVKAVRDGEKLIVYDVLPLEGGGKISKACL